MGHAVRAAQRHRPGAGTSGDRAVLSTNEASASLAPGHQMFSNHVCSEAAGLLKMHIPILLGMPKCFRTESSDSCPTLECS